MTRKNSVDEAKRLMGALVRMKPKPHEDMKLGVRQVKDDIPKKNGESLAKMPGLPKRKPSK